MPKEYKLKQPGGAKAGEFVDGARVVILAEKDAAGNWIALRVLVKPVKLITAPVTGVVTSVED